MELGKQELYTLLKEYVANNDSKGWNLFRKKNRRLIIDLSDMDLSELRFEKFNLTGVIFQGVRCSTTYFDHCLLNKTNFKNAECFGATFDHCNLVSSEMMDSNFAMAKFLECDMRFSNFTNSMVHQVRMIQCNVNNSIFYNASMNDTDLQGSQFQFSDLRECEFFNIELEDCDFEAAFVDGKTIFWNCYYNKETNFTGVGLSGCRVEPILLSSFQCNIRRIWWKNWYAEKVGSHKEHLEQFKKNPVLGVKHLFYFLGNQLMTAIVKFFWWITDYGSSTVRLLSVFSGITLFFTAIYIIFPHLTNDPLLNNSTNVLRVTIRALYFAIVVNTGLGFGEINASETSIIGHLIISTQSLIGFVLLGAFLVRIGILFQGEFPVASSRSNDSTTRH